MLFTGSSAMELWVLSFRFNFIDPILTLTNLHPCSSSSRVIPFDTGHKSIPYKYLLLSFDFSCGVNCIKAAKFIYSSGARIFQSTLHISSEINMRIERGCRLIMSCILNVCMCMYFDSGYHCVGAGLCVYFGGSRIFWVKIHVMWKNFL